MEQGRMEPSATTFRTPQPLIHTLITAVALFRTSPTNVLLLKFLKSLVRRQPHQLSTIHDIVKSATKTTPGLLLRSLNTVFHRRTVGLILVTSNTGSAAPGDPICSHLYRGLLLGVMRSQQGSLGRQHRNLALKEALEV